MAPLYALVAPAHFVSALTSGAVTPMVTAGGLTTPLVDCASGLIVGAATLVPVGGTAAGTGASAGLGGGTAAGAVAAGGIALGPVLLVGGAAALVGVAGVLVYRHRSKRRKLTVAEVLQPYMINEWGTAGVNLAVADAERIIDDEIERLSPGVVAPTT